MCTRATPISQARKAQLLSASMASSAVRPDPNPHSLSPHSTSAPSASSGTQPTSEMMPYSGDRRPSPPPPPPPQPQPHATLSYLSPSATPFTVSRPRDAIPDPTPNAPANPSPYPELPTAPSLYDSWVEPPASYMDLEAGATPGFTGELASSLVTRVVELRRLIC
jgi:hypothetical protein